MYSNVVILYNIRVSIENVFPNKFDSVLFHVKLSLYRINIIANHSLEFIEILRKIKRK